MRLSALGPALGLVLMQRGRLILHASAVSFGGRAVAFLGGHGFGKSTMAATLRSRGHRLLADDLCVIADEARAPHVVPGFPQLKLWPGAIDAVGGCVDGLPRALPTHEKRLVQVPDGFRTDPAPLARLYLLGGAADVGIEALSAQVALKQLLPHWFGARFGGKLIDSIDLGRHFMQLAELAKRVPVHRLRRPLDGNPGASELLDALERAISADLAGS